MGRSMTSPGALVRSVLAPCKAPEVSDDSWIPWLRLSARPISVLIKQRTAAGCSRIMSLLAFLGGGHEETASSRREIFSGSGQHQAECQHEQDAPATIGAARRQPGMTAKITSGSVRRGSIPVHISGADPREIFAGRRQAVRPPGIEHRDQAPGTSAQYSRGIDGVSARC